MTTKTKRVILDKIIELTNEQNRIQENKQAVVDNLSSNTVLIKEADYIINFLEKEIEFLKSLLFDLFD